ncbi:hypothetical protein [Methanobrevibacter sp.]|uniref:hypothetical protein n=1 Tax=Methanobrevibacter sp. TaxID=66852 RepID=UPI00388E672C
MEKETLISSYDEINDTFVGKIEGKNGYCADYGISEGIYLIVDKNNLPTSVLVDRASEVFDVSKNFMENPNIKIGIDCDGVCLCFSIFIEELKVCSVKCKNTFGIPEISFVMDSNS